MTNSANINDPLELLRKMWGNMGVPLPGMAVPTLDVEEIDKRISDLKAVEGWLKMNLSMLQLHIQGLEMQSTTLAAMKNLGQAGDPAQTGNAFINTALWPLNALQQAANAVAAANVSPADAKKKED